MATLDQILERAQAGEELRVWMASGVITGCRMVRWDAEWRVLVCRGGEGFTDDDVHYLRGEHVLAVTRRERRPPDEGDWASRFALEARDELRGAAGYALSLAIRPNSFSSEPDELREWVSRISTAVSEVCSLEPRQKALQSAVDQILLREGNVVAVLGGSTLIFEAKPGSLPEVDKIRLNLESLL